MSYNAVNCCCEALSSGMPGWLVSIVPMNVSSAVGGTS